VVNWDGTNTAWHEPVTSQKYSTWVVSAPNGIPHTPTKHRDAGYHHSACAWRDTEVSLASYWQRESSRQGKDPSQCMPGRRRSGNDGYILEHSGIEYGIRPSLP